MKNCRPKTLWNRFLNKVFGIILTCDHRCLENYDAPCQFDGSKSIETKKLKSTE
jgi:hypothetical protein